MAEKTKSIIEEALLDAKSLEDALKANTKEMLSAHMSKEIESIVESSLIKEDEEAVEDDIEKKGSADDVKGVELELDNELPDDSEEEESGEFEKEVMDLPDDGKEMAVLDLDLDTDLDLDAGEGEEEEFELGLEPMDMELGVDDDVLDMTMSSDDEVVTVFKKLGPDDEVEVVKDASGIHLTDNETGAEYYIKEGLEELGDDGDDCEDCPSEGKVMYEIELDEESDLDEMWGSKSHEFKRHDVDGVEKKSGDVYAHYKDYESPFTKREEDDELSEDDESLEDDDVSLEEDRIRQHRKDGYHKYVGNRARNESKRSRKPVIRRKPKTDRVSETKIMKEYKELKSKNNEYKKALNVFKDKLNEVALFNTNLAYVNRLFTEHSTTKKEKMEILKRFDSAESVKESKSTYKTIKSELDRKAPISESVENKVNKTVKSSKSDLNESTAYVDPQIVAIKDLMRRIS
jgi:hypothetical protein